MSPFRLTIAAAFLLGIYENYKKIREIRSSANLQTENERKIFFIKVVTFCKTECHICEKTQKKETPL